MSGAWGLDCVVLAVCFALFGTAWAAGLATDAISYGAGISAFEKVSAAWAAELESDAISCGAGIRAFKRTGIGSTGTLRSGLGFDWNVDWPLAGVWGSRGTALASPVY